MSRDQKIIAIITLGVLWGTAEIIIGDLLQTYSLPVRGIVLTAIASMFIISAKGLADFNGSVILLGIISVILKGVYYQTIFHSALYAVIAQTVIAELLFIGIKNYLKYSMLTGVILLVYTFAHGVIMHGVYFGTHIFTTYKNLLRGVWLLDPISATSLELILIFFGLLHALVGLFVGWLTFISMRKIKPAINSFIEN